MISGIGASGEMKVSPIGLIYSRHPQGTMRVVGTPLFKKKEGKNIHHLMCEWMD